MVDHLDGISARPSRVERIRLLAVQACTHLSGDATLVIATAFWYLAMAALLLVVRRLGRGSC
jgi:hypothetical protein